MSKAQQAVDCFKGGFSCSQAILATYAEDHGLSRETALKLADGFGGGIADRGDTCGAVAGAVMVIGLRYGRKKARDQRAKDQTTEAVQEFIRRFEARSKSILCRDILGCDIDTPEKMEAASKQGLFGKICTQAVRDAAEILEEIVSNIEH